MGLAYREVLRCGCDEGKAIVALACAAVGVDIRYPRHLGWVGGSEEAIICTDRSSQMVIRNQTQVSLVSPAKVQNH